MDLPYEDYGFGAQRSDLETLPSAIKQRYQRILDIITPYKLPRWLFTIAIIVYITYRVVHYDQWHFVLYVLGVHFIGETVRFFTPLVYPEIGDSDSKSGPTLPVSNDEEFKPFVRQLSEFRYWYSSTVGCLIATFCTLFDLFHIPVFWPFLAVYFCLYLLVVMREEVGNMIKYKYLPWTRGKIRYRVT